MFASETIRHPDGRTSKVFRVGQGPLVVWLHGPRGVPGSDPVIHELAKRHTVVAPLAPGFADLAELDEIRNVHELALHYDDVLQALGLDAVTLIGHSFGAMVAAEVAAHFPRRVARLVLISPLGLWQDQHPLPDMFGQVPYLMIDTLLWKAGKAIPAMADPADEPNDPVERQVAIAQALTSVAKFVWPLPDRGLRRRLPRITAQTLVIAGADDRFVPASYVEEFASLVRGAGMAIIPDAAHMVPYEQPADVFRKLDGWISAGAFSDDAEAASGQKMRQKVKD
jgi:pimeloyl-ACP methyl ester carboxylesterase